MKALVWFIVLATVCVFCVVAEVYVAACINAFACGVWFNDLARGLRT